MVFAAGKGERLHPFTLTTPKPLFKIQGKALLDIALDRLAAYGVEQCVVNAHYLKDQIEKHLAHRTHPCVILSYEEELLNTGGGLLKVLPYFSEDLLWGFNTDAWWENPEDDVLSQMASAWRDEDMDCLLLQIPQDYALGMKRVDYHLKPDGRLHSPSEELKGSHIYPGIQLVHRRSLEKFKPGKFSMKSVWDQAESAGRLFGFSYEGKWADVATLEVAREIEAYLNGKER